MLFQTRGETGESDSASTEKCAEARETRRGKAERRNQEAERNSASAKSENMEVGQTVPAYEACQHGS